MAAKAKRPKILIVDDDPFIRDVLSDILETGQCAVHTAENGEVAFGKCSQAAGFDLIISDINMPVMGGLALIKKLRGIDIETPIIVLSGNNEISTALSAIKEGAGDYLLKDENIQDTIVLAVNRALEKQHILEQNRQLMADNARMIQSLESVVRKMTEIGTALSAEKEFSKLLEMIVSHARSITNADAGTLYLVENKFLRFVIIQNDMMKIRMGGKSGEKIPYPPIEIKESNVSGFAALKGATINIPDVYSSELFDFTGPKKFDASTGYRSKSMLVLPLKNHENEVVGVLQLLNAKDPKSSESIPFDKESENQAESIASQAAVAITNSLLARDMENLFEAFVEVMATAIDEKSPVTGGHIRRMTDLTLTLADEVNEQKSGPFADLFFNNEQMHQLRIAALMHDIGKVTTPTEIVEKSKKLETIFDRVHLVQLRIRYVAKLVMIEGYGKRMALMENGGTQAEIQAVADAIKQRVAELEAIAVFVGRCNEPGEFLEEEKLAKLKAIHGMTYMDDEKEHNFLTESELENLSIRKGSITEKERKKMQDHAAVTVKMLNKIPFTRKMKEIPRFAGAHHEYINGKGYPLGLKGDEIPLEGRLMAVADIAEALTAADRPYKKAMPLDVVYKILRSMAQNGELDPNLVNLFIENKIYERYLSQQVNPAAVPK